MPVVQGGQSDDDDDGLFAPPAGNVLVVGALSSTQTRGRLGPTDPGEGTLDTLARADLERLQQQVDYDLYPAYIRLSNQDPAQTGDLPLPLGPNDVDAGPHLGYAFQWFSFSLIAIVGYPLVLRRVARGHQGGGGRPAAATHVTGGVLPSDNGCY